MTDGAWEVVGKNFQELTLGKTVGDALRDLIKRRWKNNAAKTMERRWGLDPKTARNVATSGNVSERTLTKAVRAERWALWMALGEELLEETYADYLHQMIEENARATQRIEQHREEVRSLEASASRLVDLGRGMAAE